jgi:mannose-1-phosphate guanylyltransferase
VDAFILAGGHGTRLGTAAEGRPKPLVEIAGRPLLAILMEKLFELNIDHVYINSHHLSEQITQFRDASLFRDRITILHEVELLGTAGTIRNFLQSGTQKELLIMHGDNFFEDDLQKLLVEFCDRKMEIYGVAGTFLSPRPELCGIFEVSDESVIVKMHEKQEPKFGNLANSAIYILDARALAIIKDLPAELNDLSRNVLPLLMGKLVAVPLEGFFIDIGSPQNLELARTLTTKGQ